MASVSSSSSSMLRSSCSYCYCYKDYMGSFKTQALLFRNHHHRRMLASKPFSLPGCLSFNINHRVLRHIASDSGSRKSQAPTETEDIVPTPIVIIDQDSESDATVVELSFGDRLGALLDTTKSLKDLGLDVVKGSVSTDQFGTRTKFYITRRDTGRKVDNPESLEAIRLTIISNLLKYHPESSERLAMGEAWGVKAPKKKLDVDIATHINVASDGPKRSLLIVETADRPGLLMEIVQVITHINLDVDSAEIDTEGLVAKDKFHVSYHGTALDKVLAEELRNCLRYLLRRPEANDDSY